MSDYVSTIGLFFMGVFFMLLIIGLVRIDSDCVKLGGRLKTVSEHQAKGTMNHTECEFEH